MTTSTLRTYRTAQIRALAERLEATALDLEIVGGLPRTVQRVHAAVEDLRRKLSEWERDDAGGT